MRARFIRAAIRTAGMQDPDMAVFGHITLKEIIGARPPAVPDLKAALDAILDRLTEEIKGMDRRGLLRLLEDQREAAAAVNSRPGAMALAQDKIRLYNEYNTIYVRALEEAAAGHMRLAAREEPDSQP